MSVYINGNDNPIQLAERKDIVNQNLAYSELLNSTDSRVDGSTKIFLHESPTLANYDYVKIPLRVVFKKGDIFTISAFSVLTGPQANGFYKATIFSKSATKSYDDKEDTNWLKAGIRSSKMIVVNADSDPNDPPYLLVYSGIAGKTGGNTLTVKELKVESGSVATPYIPAVEDLVLKSDYDALSSRLSALESKMGGVKPSYRLYYATSVKEVA